MKNKAIKADIILVIITIILPLLFSSIKSEFQLAMVPLLIFLYIGCKKINNDTHKLYLNEEEINKENTKISTETDTEGNINFGKNINIKKGANLVNKPKILKDIVILIITGVLLFFIGDLLGDTLDTLCRMFNVPEVVIGIVLGFVTSIPELITFFEAQRHHKNSQNDMLGVIEATNNLLMSNMMNLFVIQSIGIILFSIP